MRQKSGKYFEVVVAFEKGDRVLCLQRSLSGKRTSGCGLEELKDAIALSLPTWRQKGF